MAYLCCSSWILNDFKWFKGEFSYLIKDRGWMRLVSSPKKITTEIRTKLSIPWHVPLLVPPTEAFWASPALQASPDWPRRVETTQKNGRIPLFWVVILFLCFFHSDASQRPSTVFFFQKLVCLWPCIPTSPIYNHHRNIGSHSNQPINPTCSISGVDLAFVSFGVPVSPFAFLGLRLLRGNFNGILPGESTKRFTSTTKLPKAKKTWIFGCHDSFFDMKKKCG